MNEIKRITRPLLDVLEIFLESYDNGGDEPYGRKIMRTLKRSGPTVYGILDRLEDAGWVAGRWEEEHPEPGTPRRRFYRLTVDGAAGARRILAERRPSGEWQANPPDLATGGTT